MEVSKITFSSEEVDALTPWEVEWHTVTNALSYPKVHCKISAVAEMARQSVHSVENSQAQKRAI
jgi:hypothetical protein